MFARWSDSVRSPPGREEGHWHCNSSEGPKREISDGAVRMKVEVSDACDLPPGKVLWKPDPGREEIRGKNVTFTEVILFKATVMPQPVRKGEKMSCKLLIAEKQWVLRIIKCL